MAASIDQLQIEVNASATRANDAVEQLIDKLGRLSAGLNKLDGNKIVGLANGVQKLGTAMQTMNAVKTNEFTRLANNLKKLADLDTASINRSATAISNIGKTIGNLSGVAQAGNQLTELATGIKQLGYKSSTKAIENIPKLAAAMSELMATLSRAPRVSQNLISMTSALANLARTGASSGSAATTLSRSLNTYSVSANRANKSTHSLAAAFGKMYATYWLVFRAFRKIGDAINIASDLVEVQNVVDVTFDDMAYKVEEFAQSSIKQFGMSELSLKQYASRFQAMGSAMGIDSSLISSANKNLNAITGGYVGLSDSMSDVSLTLTKLTADMASFYNVEQADVAEDLASIYTGMARPLRTYGLDLTEATLREWAMKNGLDANIDSMSQAEKTMLRYQYVLANTGAAQGDFARTSNTWANQIRILKQQFQQLATIIGTVFINALKPLVNALNNAMSHIIAFAQTVSNALGKIFGWKYETGTGGVTSDLEDGEDAADGIESGMSGAADAAKKLRSYLLGIDELNVLEPDTEDSTSSGSGSGSTGGTGSGSSAGTDGGWEKTESLFESEIDSLYKLGEYIGKTLTDMLNGIDWESVYEGARNFGKGLADFLNGLISPELFGAIGRTIAGALNTALHFLNSFWTNFDWEDFGLSIATSINEFFSTFDFALLAQTLNVWADGIKEMIATALSNIDLGNALNGIKEFFSNLELDTIGIIVGLIVIKKWGKVILSGIGAAIAGKISASIVAALGAAEGTSLGMAILGWIGRGIASITSGIGLVIEGLFSGLTFSEALAGAFGGSASAIAGVATTVSGVIVTIGGAVFAVINFISMLQDGFSWINTILMTIGSVLASIGVAILAGLSIPIAALVGVVIAAVGAIVILIKDNWNEICAWFSSTGEWINANVIQPVIGLFSNLWTKVSGFFSNLWRDITAIWVTASTWFSENIITPIVNFFVGFATRVQQIFEGLWIIIQAIWIIVTTWINDNIIIPLVEAFTVFGEFISNLFLTLWTGIQEVWSFVSTWFNETVIIPLTEFFRGVWTNVKTFFSKLWTDIKKIWILVSTWFNNTVILPVQNAFETACETIGGFFEALWSGIKRGVVGAMNTVISGIETGINYIVNGLNEILSGFNKVVSWAAQVAEVSWGGVDLIPTVSLPRIKGFLEGGFPEKYSLFMAGENGIPEIAGTVGGRTAVAGGSEITGIRDAVYDSGDTTAELLGTVIDLLGIIADKDYDIEIDGRSVVEALSNRQKRNGYSFA